MAKLVSGVYGNAFMEVATEKNKVDEFYEEICVIKDIFSENKNLIKLLNHPQIDKEDKKEIIKNIFEGRISDEITGLFLTVTEKERQECIPEILDYIIDAVKEYKSIGVVYVTSAVELTENQKKNLEEKLKETAGYNSYEINYQVDKDILGGMIIRINDRVVDSSIKTKLDNMTEGTVILLSYKIIIFRKAEIQKYRNTEIQNTEIQNTEIQKYKNTKIQKYKKY